MVEIFLAVRVILGAVLGSFACCQAWRVRYNELGKKELGRRSVCLCCGKTLKWYENIPLVSYAVQRGRCRKCGVKIGKAEIFSEVGGVVAFLLLGWRVWNRFFGSILFGSLEGAYVFGIETWARIIHVILIIIFMTILMILAVYDAKWRRLPVAMLIAVIVVAGAYAGIGLILGEVKILELVGAVAILAGTYYLLYFLSKEKLVGGGDYLLCLAIALMIAEPVSAIWVLFLSNFIGAIIMLPLKKKKIAFGPFLVIAFVLVFVFQELLAGLISFGK